MYSFEEYKNELLQDPEFNEIRRIMKAKDLTQSSLPKVLR